MKHRRNNHSGLHKFKKTIVALITTIIILLIALAINVYAATTGINNELNEGAIVRLSGAMAMGNDANRIVTRDAVETVLSGYNIGSSVVTVTDDVTNDYIVVTYSATSNQYLIDKNTIYTITYDANGGTGAPAAQEHKHNESTTLSSTKPTKSNFYFKGWSTSSTATEPTYLAGGTYTGNGDVTLYAVWQAMYTVTYDANGGSGAPASQIKYHGTTLTLTTDEPTRSNHEFKGWSKSSSATEPTYLPGATYTEEGDVTLYAVWQAIYIITYDANGGTGAPLAQEKPHGESVTLSTTKPTRSNYNFLGWSKSSSATEATYQSGATYNEEGNVTLYAVWQAIYTITYNANGGTGAPSAQTKLHGVSITLSSDEPEREYFYFRGWGTSASATSATYQPGETYTAEGNATLYAVWDAYEFTITYHPNGGTGGPDSQTYKYAASGTVNLSTEVPERTGYLFKGWSQSSTATSATYSPGQEWERSQAANYDLYAVWEAKTYTITYHPNGGTGTISATTYTYDESGTTVKLTTSETTKTGNSFLGWSETSTDTTATYASGYAWSRAIAKNTDLYAIYEPNDYTITYDVNGGTGTISPTTYTYATSGTVNLTTSVPEKTGYRFKGWDKSSTASTPTYASGAAFSKTVAENTTLYAIWEVKSYTITYAKYNMIYNLGDVAPTTSTYATYRIDDNVVSVTSTRDDGYGYITYRVYLEANKTYIFNCTTSGTWGTTAGENTVEAFLMLDGSTSTDFYHMKSANYTFIPATTGEYHLRLDVNKSGQTHTFSNIKIAEVVQTATKTYGSTYGTMPSPTKTGYTFVGWYDDTYVDNPLNFYADKYSDLKTAFGYDEDSLYNHYVNYGKSENRQISQYISTDTVVEDKTLYGYMKPTGYTITYNANGGSNAPSAQTKKYGVNLILSTTVPTRSGYTFLGWGTSTSDTTVDYAAGATYTANSSITLYAIWKADTYTVWSGKTFSGSGGEGGASSSVSTTADLTNFKYLTLSVSMSASGEARGPHDTVKFYIGGTTYVLTENTWQESYTFDQEYDISSLTGSQTLGLDIFVNAASDTYPCNFSGTVSITLHN